MTPPSASSSCSSSSSSASTSAGRCSRRGTFALPPFAAPRPPSSHLESSSSSGAPASPSSISSSSGVSGSISEPLHSSEAAAASALLDAPALDDAAPADARVIFDTKACLARSEAAALAACFDCFLGSLSALRLRGFLSLAPDVLAMTGAYGHEEAH